MLRFLFPFVQVNVFGISDFIACFCFCGVRYVLRAARLRMRGAGRGLMVGNLLLARRNVERCEFTDDATLPSCSSFMTRTTIRPTIRPIIKVDPLDDMLRELRLCEYSY